MILERDSFSMIMDGLDTLCDVALADTDQLYAIATTSASYSGNTSACHTTVASEQDLLNIPYEDILQPNKVTDVSNTRMEYPKHKGKNAILVYLHGWENT